MPSPVAPGLTVFPFLPRAPSPTTDDRSELRSPRSTTKGCNPWRSPAVPEPLSKTKPSCRPDKTHLPPPLQNPRPLGNFPLSAATVPEESGTGKEVEERRAVGTRHSRSLFTGLALIWLHRCSRMTRHEHDPPSHRGPLLFEHTNKPHHHH
jgi:hypothetical protein